MALTSTTVFDVGGATQSITFSNPSQVDQISFSNNQVTFEAESSYNLVKSDLLLYGQYLQAFNTLLYVNFPSVGPSYNLAWPLCQFDITETNVGVQHINYTETSLGNTVLGINYVPLAGAAGFTARASPVTITLQEFFMCCFMMLQYCKQISLN
jgi:hypothetical protein